MQIMLLNRCVGGCTRTNELSIITFFSLTLFAIHHSTYFKDTDVNLWHQNQAFSFHEVCLYWTIELN